MSSKSTSCVPKPFMNEIRNLLRFTLPGLVVVVVLTLSLVIPENGIPIEDSISQDGFANVLSVILGAIVGSGALGYLLANIYFCLIFLPKIEEVIPGDYTNTLTQLMGAKRLQIINVDGSPNNGFVFNKRNAWEIVNIVAYSSYAKGMEHYLELVSWMLNVCSGLGAIIVGLIISFISWCCVYFLWLNNCLCHSIIEFISVLIAHVILILALARTYWVTLKSVENMTISTFSGHILNQSHPVKIVYGPNNK